MLDEKSQEPERHSWLQPNHKAERRSVQALLCTDDSGMGQIFEKCVQKAVGDECDVAVRTAFRQDTILELADRYPFDICFLMLHHIVTGWQAPRERVACLLELVRILKTTFGKPILAFAPLGTQWLPGLSEDAVKKAGADALYRFPWNMADVAVTIGGLLRHPMFRASHPPTLKAPWAAREEASQVPQDVMRDRWSRASDPPNLKVAWAAWEEASLAVRAAETAFQEMQDAMKAKLYPHGHAGPRTVQNWARDLVAEVRKEAASIGVRQQVSLKEIVSEGVGRIAEGEEKAVLSVLTAVNATKKALSDDWFRRDGNWVGTRAEMQLDVACDLAQGIEKEKPGLRFVTAREIVVVLEHVLAAMSKTEAR